MDTSIARSHLMTASQLLREKAGDKARDTAAGQLVLAMASLCDKLDEANRETHGPVGLPGVFHSVPQYEKHTSPFRHRFHDAEGAEATSKAADEASQDRLALAVQDWEGGVAPVLGIGARELAKDVD